MQPSHITGYIVGIHYFLENTKDFSPSLQGTQRIGNISAVVRMVLTLQQGGVGQVVLVCHPKDKPLAQQVAHLGVRLVLTEPQDKKQNQEPWDLPLQTALALARKETRPALVVGESTPLFRVSTVQALLQKTQTTQPVYQGGRGFPVLLSPDDVRRLSYEEQTTKALAQVLSQGNRLETQDKGVVVDHREHPLYSQAVQEHSLTARLRPEVRVRIGREKPFLGPGTAQLLTLISSTGSVRQACQQMGISYSKGWNMITLMEEQLGQPIVERQQGGRQGGHAHLTSLGEQFLNVYHAFAEDSRQAVERLFDQYFSQFPLDF